MFPLWMDFKSTFSNWRILNFLFGSYWNSRDMRWVGKWKWGYGIGVVDLIIDRTLTFIYLVVTKIYKIEVKINLNLNVHKIIYF